MLRLSIAKTVFFLLVMLPACSTSAFSSDSDELSPRREEELSVDGLMRSISNRSHSSQTLLSRNDLKEIRQIFVTGNRQVSRDLISESSGLKVGQKAGSFDLSQASRRLKSQGVFEAVSIKSFPISGGISTSIAVTENAIVGRVKFDGNRAVSSATLNTIISIQPGDLLNKEKVRSDIDALRKLYQEQGYIYAAVVGVQMPSAKDGDLIFQIAEGEIDEIIITGNLMTKDYIILREMTIKSGDVIQANSLKENLRRIYNTGYFQGISPDFLPGDTPFSRKLVIKVDERKAGTISFGAGFGGSDNWFVFSRIDWKNVFGTGQEFSLNGQLGKQSTFQSTYFNPWFTSDRKSLTLQAWMTNGNFDVFNQFNQFSQQNQSRRGGRVALGWPFTYDFYSSHALKLERVNIKDGFSYGVASYQYGLFYDTRDYRLNPRSGVFHSVEIERGFPLINSIDFWRTDLQFRQFIPTFDNQTIALNLSLGRISNNPIDTETYYVGGQNTVRGYSDVGDEVQVGRNRLVANAEYRFLFSDMFQFVVFLDAGVANNFLTPIWNYENYLFGKGVGIRVITPLGPLRLDWGFPTAGEPQLHFAIGQSF